MENAPMQIYNDLSELNISGTTAVALGNFDGLHIGHRVIMEDAVTTARARGMKSLCFTFSNHPFNFILRRSDSDPDAVKLICTEEEKIGLVRDMGFDILVNIPFDETIMKMRAGAFFEDIVVSVLRAGYISVGFNYTYGARAEGRPDNLVVSCRESGIDVTIHDAVRARGNIVSSSLIRDMILKGDMEAVAEYLGRPYSFEGIVGHGRHIGRKNGFPTINIPAPRRQMLPPNGVYFSRILLGGRTYDSISNIGINPTVNTDAGRDNAESDAAMKMIETYIFDFNDNVYGDDVTVYFDHFSRGERRFGSRDELFEQIAKDCEAAAIYHHKSINPL